MTAIPSPDMALRERVAEALIAHSRCQIKTMREELTYDCGISMPLTLAAPHAHQADAALGVVGPRLDALTAERDLLHVQVVHLNAVRNALEEGSHGEVVERNAALARAEKAEATLERVRALADEWERDNVWLAKDTITERPPFWRSENYRAWEVLRAALDTES